MSSTIRCREYDQGRHIEMFVSFYNTAYPIENKSFIYGITVTVRGWDGSAIRYYHAKGTLDINGHTAQYDGSNNYSQLRLRTSGNYDYIGTTDPYIYPFGNFGSGFYVNHDSSGKLNLKFTFKPSSGESYFTFVSDEDQSYNFTFSTDPIEHEIYIDREAPVIALSVTPVSDTQVSFISESDQPCDNWQYKIDSLGWTNFQPNEGEPYEIDGLTAARHTLAVRATRTYNGVVGTSTTVSFETTLPTVTARLSNPTYNSLDLSATATATCDLWEYSLDNGSNWTTFSTTSGTSASTTLTSLQPNTTYSVLVRARKVSNGLKGVSSAATGTTNGGSILTRANNSALDVSSPSISFVVTVKETLYHKLKIYKKNGTTLVKTITVGTLEVGTGQTVTKAISSTVKNALLNCFPSAKTYDFKITLESFSDSGYQTSLGESGPVVWKGTTSEANSKPTFTTFVYCDTETETVDATGDDQVLIQVASHLLVTATAGTAKNGASISGYSASIGDVSLSGASTTLDVGAVSSSGDLTLRVTCTDSRGYSTSVDKTVTVLPYSKPRFTMFNLRRRNEIEDLVQLYFNGAISSIMVDNVEKNSIVSVSFMWKLTSADDSAYVTVDLTDAAEMTINGLTFSYSNSELMTLDEMNSYDFVFYVYDELGNTTVFIYHTILNQGTPLLSFRKKTNSLPPRVGLNNPEPLYELDVHGNIAMHDVLVMGFVASLGTDYLTAAAYRKGGIYVQTDTTKATTTKGYPVAGKAGILEVLADPDGHAVQRYTTFEAAVYVRAYDGTAWTSWKTISMS